MQQPTLAAGDSDVRRWVRRRTGLVMNAVLWVALVIGSPAVGIGIYDLQTKLERWVYQRHAED